MLRATKTASTCLLARLRSMQVAGDCKGLTGHGLNENLLTPRSGHNNGAFMVNISHISLSRTITTQDAHGFVGTVNLIADAYHRK